MTISENKLKAAYKGMHLFAELPMKYKSKHLAKKAGLIFTRAGLAATDHRVNVIAVEPDSLSYGVVPMFDAYGTVQDENPAMVCHVTPSRAYLRERCVRINKELAFKLHPHLASYLYRANELSKG